MSSSVIEFLRDEKYDIATGTKRFYLSCPYARIDRFIAPISQGSPHRDVDIRQEVIYSVTRFATLVMFSGLLKIALWSCITLQVRPLPETNGRRNQK